jgi:2-polyprenyl-3-methyl-5-hydroxy-6-metoxy-1,4-benzoquinol methylase
VTRFLAARATEPERLDEGVAEEEALRSLQDLRFVNRWLSNARSIHRAVRAHLSPGGRLLDVGSASGDVPAMLLSRTAGPVMAVALDVKALHLRLAPPSLRRVVADVRALPFAERSFDVVTASLFLHHFDAEDLPPLLRSLFALARRVLVVNDLHRAAVPYVFGRALFPMLFRSRVSVEDGLVSIRRGFRPAELRAAFAAAGVPLTRLERRFPYRLLAVAERPAPAALAAARPAPPRAVDGSGGS